MPSRTPSEAILCMGTHHYNLMTIEKIGPQPLQGSALDAIALLLSDHLDLEVNSVEHIRLVTENTRSVSRPIHAIQNLLQELENRTTGTSPLANTELSQTCQRNHII